MSPFEIPETPIWQMSDHELEGVLLWAEKPEWSQYKLKVLLERLRRERGYERDDQVLIDMGR